MGLPEDVEAALTPGQVAQVENALTQTQGDLEEAMKYALGDSSAEYENHPDY